jgi:hypothetical protein
VSDQPPSDDDFPILGTPEEQATDDEKVLQALRLVSPQTSEELAGNTELEPAMVGLAIGRLARSGGVRIRPQAGADYVLLEEGDSLRG